MNFGQDCSSDSEQGTFVGPEPAAESVELSTIAFDFVSYHTHTIELGPMLIHMIGCIDWIVFSIVLS